MAVVRVAAAEAMAAMGVSEEMVAQQVVHMVEVGVLQAHL